MPEPQAFRRFAQITQKWRDLVELRCAYFVELHTTGRWRRYYDEARFLLLMREALALVEVWWRIAPRPEDARGRAPAQSGRVANPRRRNAA